MQETETKIKKTILGDIKVASYLNEISNRYEILRNGEKRRTQAKDNLPEVEEDWETSRKII